MVSNKKEYLKEYHRKNKVYRKIVDENGVIMSNTLNIRATVYKKKNCKRCEMLFKFGGKGNGIICSDCLNKEKNGKEGYYTRRNKME